MKTAGNYLNLIMICLFLASCSKSPLYVFSPYYFHISMDVDGEAFDYTSSDQQRGLLFEIQHIPGSPSNVKAPTFLNKENDSGKPYVIFYFSDSARFDFFWVCDDEAIVDSKKYYYNPEIHKEYDSEDNALWNRTQEVSENITGSPVTQMWFNGNIAGGKLQSGWMSFTRKADKFYLAYTAEFEADFLDSKGKTVEIRNGRLDISHKYLDLDNKDLEVPIK